MTVLIDALDRVLAQVGKRVVHSSDLAGTITVQARSTVRANEANSGGFMTTHRIKPITMPRTLVCGVLALAAGLSVAAPASTVVMGPLRIPAPRGFQEMFLTPSWTDWANAWCRIGLIPAGSGQSLDDFNATWRSVRKYVVIKDLPDAPAPVRGNIGAGFATQVVTLTRPRANGATDYISAASMTRPGFGQAFYVNGTSERCETAFNEFLNAIVITESGITP